jgi:hypothetical protein
MLPFVSRSHPGDAVLVEFAAARQALDVATARCATAETERRDALIRWTEALASVATSLGDVQTAEVLHVSLYQVRAACRATEGAAHRRRATHGAGRGSPSSPRSALVFRYVADLAESTGGDLPPE